MFKRMAKQKNDFVSWALQNFGPEYGYGKVVDQWFPNFCKQDPKTN